MIGRRENRNAVTRIVLSGPESSGKSTLATALAKQFGVPMAPEYARFHLESGKPYPQSSDDLTEMARQHLAWQRQHVTDDAPCAILDTDMLNYLIWADVAFGCIPQAIEAWLTAESHHVHLLCEPDLQWHADPLREFPDLEKRRELFDRHVRELERREIRYFVIRGEGDARASVAQGIIETACGLPPEPLDPSPMRD